MEIDLRIQEFLQHHGQIHIGGVGTVSPVAHANNVASRRGWRIYGIGRVWRLSELLCF
jgi:hypothetical protein